MIRLIDEEINEAWHKGCVGSKSEQVPKREIAKAQLKKVVDWLTEKYGVFLYDDATTRQEFPIDIEIDWNDPDWQALLEEVKE